jgi:succinate dehydrogenase / fumarate reductase cytochrome b subunit
MAIKLSRTFILRKLHQLSGIMPLGFFLLAHFFTNSKALQGYAAFNTAVEDIQHIPYLPLIELFGIGLPLVYHSVYGLFITFEAKPNPFTYAYERNWFYVLQRVTGVILFFFIILHLLHFRFGVLGALGLDSRAVATHPEIAFNIVSGDFMKNWVFIVYIIGIASTVFHLANGLWLFAVDWGIAIGEKAQRAVGYACFAFGAGLLAVGINAAAAFVRPGGLLGLFK